jgi:hypothetical protein
MDEDVEDRQVAGRGGVMGHEERRQRQAGENQ